MRSRYIAGWPGGGVTRKSPSTDLIFCAIDRYLEAREKRRMIWGGRWEGVVRITILAGY